MRTSRDFRKLSTLRVCVCERERDSVCVCERERVKINGKLLRKTLRNIELDLFDQNFFSENVRD